MGTGIKKLFNGDKGLAQAGEERDDPVTHGKESVVATGTDADTCAGTGTYLADDDLTSLDYFAAIFFDTATLARSRTGLTSGSTCFDVTHSF